MVTKCRRPFSHDVDVVAVVLLLVDSEQLQRELLPEQRHTELRAYHAGGVQRLIQLVDKYFTFTMHLDARNGNGRGEFLCIRRDR